MTAIQTCRPDHATSPGTTVTRRPHTDAAVTVGVHGSEQNLAAIDRPTDGAETTARPLTLLSVLADYQIPIPDCPVATNDDRDWKVLHELAADITRGRPHLSVSHAVASGGTDVRVEVAHRPGHLATVLIDAAETAPLLVLGRHDDSRLGGFPYGSVTRSVLDHAYVPVTVVPSGHQR